ncbi:hypothetical protein [Paenibacillus sp. Marseille-Q4541]|uniref:hypothetical protein n=1 Tax=Paenibacillus sp. Marseille-Q4541 TaxID=2831522 RepID=UPI001BABCD76|nr:hypothetical protein [Paenibacillus sp. Marseille-Q4541]
MENFAVILIFLSLLGMSLALTGMIKGSIKFLRVKGRRNSFIVLIASFVLLLIGVSSLPAESSQTEGTSTSTLEIVMALSIGIIMFIVFLLPVYFIVSYLVKWHKKSMNSPRMQAFEKQRAEIRRFQQFERIRIKNDRREWERRERKRAKKQTPPPTPVHYHEHHDHDHHYHDHDPYDDSSSNNDSGNDRS